MTGTTTNENCRWSDRTIARINERIVGIGGSITVGGLSGAGQPGKGIKVRPRVVSVHDVVERRSHDPWLKVGMSKTSLVLRRDRGEGGASICITVFICRYTARMYYSKSQVIHYEVYEVITS